MQTPVALIEVTIRDRHIADAGSVRYPER
jgi:hypothetical protein